MRYYLFSDNIFLEIKIFHLPSISFFLHDIIIYSIHFDEHTNCMFIDSNVMFRYIS